MCLENQLVGLIDVFFLVKGQMRGPILDFH
jgi:hypothetical protein